MNDIAIIKYERNVAFLVMPNGLTAFEIDKSQSERPVMDIISHVRVTMPDQYYVLDGAACEQYGKERDTEVTR